MSNPRVYVGTKDGVPVVGITTDKHRSLTPESLLEVLKEAEKEAREVIDNWPVDNWFPCGFASLWISGTEPLVRLLRKLGPGGTVTSSLSVSPAYGGGMHLYWTYEPHTGGLGQCMNLKAQVYGILAKYLAYLGVRASVRTMVD